MEVTTESVQVLGSNGFMKDYHVERMIRDAKITQIYEGTNDIQKLVISGPRFRQEQLSSQNPSFFYRFQISIRCFLIAIHFSKENRLNAFSDRAGSLFVVVCSTVWMVN
ncbi:hypothetical protein D7X33_11765 [Butyricicoccus sp. 1XD8-22]|nr:hypothetical protein D7X33_11765 [Butyricicoccus sp. 1XD8-22]